MVAEPESNPPLRRPPYGIYAYTAREWDPEIGLYYYRARYYDPKIGRFISEDPIGFGGGQNFYSYVENGPIGKTDPSGLFTPTATRVINELCKLYPRGCRSPVPIPPRKPDTCFDRLQRCIVNRTATVIYLTIYCELVCHHAKIPRFKNAACVLICELVTHAPKTWWREISECRREYRDCLDCSN